MPLQMHKPKPNNAVYWEPWQDHVQELHKTINGKWITCLPPLRDHSDKYLGHLSTNKSVFCLFTDSKKKLCFTTDYQKKKQKSYRRADSWKRKLNNLLRLRLFLHSNLNLKTSLYYTGQTLIQASPWSAGTQIQNIILPSVQKHPNNYYFLQ